MTFDEFSAIFDDIGVPTAYRTFKYPQTLPFIILQRSGSDDLYANGRHYHKITNAVVELYFETMDETLENSIEQSFERNGIPYVREYEEYIDSEEMFVIRWSVQIIGG